MPRVFRLCLRAVVAAVVLVLPAPLASAQTPQVRISQVFNYGGLLASQPRANYIELYNAGQTAVNLTGWTLQVSSASVGGIWQKMALIGTIGPRSYYLVQTSPGAALGTALPTPDAGPFDLATSQSGGKVALVVDSITLSGRPACPFEADIVDFVGYGDADQRTPCSAASPTFNNAPNPALPQALLRNCAGYADVGSSLDVFTPGAANPHSSASPPNAIVPVAVSPTPAGIPAYPNDTVTIVATVAASACAGAIGAVSVNLAPIGGPSSVPLALSGGQYRATINLGAYRPAPGAYQLDLTALATRMTLPGSGKVTLLVRPPNDDCANALPLSAVSPTDLVINNDGAQPDVDPGPCTASPQGDFGVWFAFIPVGSGVLRIDQTSQQDAAIAVFQNSCGPGGNIVCAADNTAAAQVSAGQIYRILVVRRNPTQATAPALHLNFSFTAAAPNDSPCTAIPLQVGVAQVGSNVDATSTNDGPTVACAGGSITPVKSVWYSFTPATTGLYRISTCGSPIDTDLSIFTVVGCGGGSGTPVYTPVPACDRVSCVGGEGGPGPGPGSADAASIDSVTLTAGVAYFVRVSSAGTPAGGLFRVLLTAIVTGACCDTGTGACTISTTGACDSGVTYLGAGTTCAPGVCVAVRSGACCDFATTACTVVQPGACAAPRGYLGDGSSCSPGACSVSNDECEHAIRVFVDSPVSGSTASATTTASLSLDTCGPSNTFDGSDVFFVFTPPVSTLYDISLCGADYDSVLSIHAGCPPTFGNRLLCSDDAVPSCDGAAHAHASRIPTAVLNAAHSYIIRVAGFAGATGNFTLSIDSSGVCCRGTTCSLALYTPQSCAASAVPGITPGFIGAATSCNAPGVSTFPCCHADFNHDAQVTAQDIFDFLAAWFMSSPFAHVGGDGVARPTQQDVIDFLNLWFAGGCV